MSASTNESLPGHVASDFYLYLWYRSQVGRGSFEVSEGVTADFWVLDKLSFRVLGEDRSSATMSGENPAASLESKAAIKGGKVVKDIRLGLRREDREYEVTLRGGNAEFTALKLPGLVKGDVVEMIYERMFLIEEATFIVEALFRHFAQVRSGDWELVLGNIRDWIKGEADGSEEAA